MKVHIEFDKEGLGTLNSLEEAIAVKTRTEVIKNAIAAFSWIAQQITAGYTVIAYKEGEMHARELCLPILENLKQKKQSPPRKTQICPACQQEAGETAVFCPQCGAALKEKAKPAKIKAPAKARQRASQPEVALPPIAPEPTTCNLGECPLCGKTITAVDAYFHCGGCERQYFCADHFNTMEQLCYDCVAKLDTILAGREDAAAPANEAPEAEESTPSMFNNAEPPASGPQIEVTSLPERKKAMLDENFKPEIITLEGSQMVLIPEGEFIMGSKSGYKDEGPEHNVFLDSYYIDLYPVTNKQYRAFLRETEFPPPKHFWDNPDFNGDTQPIIGISWDEARAYCEWAGKRLPTEAEWEKAARGIDGRQYPWGDEWIPNNCNSLETGIKKTTPVDAFPNGLSPYGVFDMAGNIYEWCEDWYDETYYTYSPHKNPAGPKFGTVKVLRGGSWSNLPGNIRVTFRLKSTPERCFQTFGFRCVKPLLTST